MLKKVQDNECYMETLIKRKSLIIFQGLFSNPNIVVSEFYQMLIFVQLIEKMKAKDFDQTWDVYKCAFGTCIPDYLLRGRGNYESSRNKDFQKLKDDFDTVKGSIKEFIKKLPDKIYYYCPKDGQKAEDVELFTIKTEIAS